MSDRTSQVEVDLVIAGGAVMTMDERDTVLRDGGLAVRDGRIVDVATSETIRARYRARTVIDGSGRLTMPGLVDTYSHAGHGLVKAVFHGAHGWPPNAVNFHGSDEAWWAAEAALSACERIRFGVTTGVTTLGATPARADHPRYAMAHAHAVRDAGIRGMVGVGPPDVFAKHIPEPYTVTDFLPDGTTRERTYTYADTLATSAEVVEACRAAFHRDEMAAFFAVPYVFGRHPQRADRRWDPVYTDADIPMLIEKAHEARSFADRHGVIVHTHMFVGTVAFAVERMGRELVDDVLGPDVVIAHANALTADEIEVIAATDAKVSAAPSTGENFWYGRCPIPEMLAAGVDVAISTDGNAPRFSMDLFKEVYRALFLNWSAFGHQRIFPVGKALRMVTIDAARVIGMDDRIGSLEPGKYADIIQIDLERPHLVPDAHLPNLVAFYVNGNDVVTTIVGGNVVMRDGAITTVDQGAVIREARRQAELAFGRVDVSKYLETSRAFWREHEY